MALQLNKSYPEKDKIKQKKMDTKKVPYLRPLPKTKEEFYEELKEIKELENASECFRFRHSVIFISWKPDDPFVNVVNPTTIAVVGLTGSGKSSTINHLFDLYKKNKIQLVENPDNAETRSVQEYNFLADCPKFGIKDAALSIIDTPGFEDTAGNEQDACNLYAIQQFFTKNKIGRPNLIFLCINGSDNRFAGKASRFLKSLQYLKYLNIINSENPNVIGVLTHACRCVPPKYELKLDEWLHSLKSKMQKYETILQDALGLHVPVVMIENKYADMELKRHGDYTALPGGELQPRNLFQECSKLFLANGDKLSHIIFDACFTAENSVSISKGKSTRTTDAEDEKLNEEEEEILSKLRDKSTFGNSNEKDWEGEKMAFLNHGYDMIHDREKRQSIFKLSYKDKGLKFGVPDESSHYKKMEISETMEMCSSLQEFHKKRAAKLGVDIDPGLFKFGIKGGWNLSKGAFNAAEAINIQHDFSLYTVSLENYSNLQFSDDFKRFMNDLPSQFEDTVECRRKFERFFDHWGQYVVTSVDVGGTITAKVKANNLGKMSFNTFQSKVVLQMKILEQRAPIDLDEGKQSNQEILFTGLDFGGGDEMLKNAFESAENLQKWHKSVKDNPVVLDSGLQLTPIYRIVEIGDKAKGMACYEAFLKLYTRTGQNITEEEETSRQSTADKAENKIKNENKHCFALKSSAVVFRNNSSEICTLSSLEIGDKVQAWSKGKQKIIFSPIIGFAHYNTVEETEFLEIKTFSEHQILITSNHLVMTGKRSQSILAMDVQVGDDLFVNKQEIQQFLVCQSKVKSIQSATENGYLAPITMQGNIFVDGILSSCYANKKSFKVVGKFSLSGHNIAHMGLLPLRIKYSVMKRQKKKIIKELD